MRILSADEQIWLDEYIELVNDAVLNVSVEMKESVLNRSSFKDICLGFTGQDFLMR
jgi:hypothetical protein